MNGEEGRSVFNNGQLPPREKLRRDRKFIDLYSISKLEGLSMRKDKFSYLQITTTGGCLKGRGVVPKQGCRVLVC